MPAFNKEINVRQEEENVVHLTACIYHLDINHYNNIASGQIQNGCIKSEKAELPPLFWERHRPIKTDTYFRTFQIRPPSENNYSFKPNYSMTLCAANRLQSVSPLVQFI